MNKVFDLKIWLIDQKIEELLYEKENIDKKIDRLYEKREDMFAEWEDGFRVLK